VRAGRDVLTRGPTASCSEGTTQLILNRREIVGIDAIRRWSSKEIVGKKVTMDVREVIDHYGDTIVRAVYDKTNLLEELILTNYFSIRDGRIVSLAIIFNQPSPY
jgi:hypothetical protein